MKHCTVPSSPTTRESQYTAKRAALHPPIPFPPIGRPLVLLKHLEDPNSGIESDAATSSARLPLWHMLCELPGLLLTS